MKHLKAKVLSIVFICVVLLSVHPLALSQPNMKDISKPLLIITIDKLNSSEFWGSKLPGLRRLLHESAIGLMNIRNGAGYFSESGYLTLGSGSRATHPRNEEEKLPLERQGPKRYESNSYYQWSLGNEYTAVQSNGKVIVPETVWLQNRAAQEDHLVTPGVLGDVFRRNGWHTYLLGDSDSSYEQSRPGRYLIMDRAGVIDGGKTGPEMAISDPQFPYGYRFNSEVALKELNSKLKRNTVILIDFGDFARLDRYQEQLLPEVYLSLKIKTWQRFDQFLSTILNQYPPEKVNLILLSPTPGKEGVLSKNILQPVVFRSLRYRSGLLESATTNWPGLIANIDFAPTVINMSGLTIPVGLPGKVTGVVAQPTPVVSLTKLNELLVSAATNQRSLLDWYMGLISIAWLTGLVVCYFYKKAVGEFCFSVVALAPLVLLLMPLLPQGLWSAGCFLVLTLIISLPFMLIKDCRERFLIIAALLTLVIILDQLLNWSLIRFSALGYSAISGSRYYGIGNECMGLLLGTAFVLTHLIVRKTGYKWPAPIILGVCTFVIGWPQLGANFGGILAAVVGVTYYLYKIYNWRISNPRIWLVMFGVGAVIGLLGWWDSLRDPELQTHIGRFFKLLFSKDLTQVYLVMIRKIQMELKLIVFSPWTRILLLAFIIGIGNRLIFKSELTGKDEQIFWEAILVTGFAALLFNDSGVLAFAICVAFAFSFLLNASKGQEEPVSKRVQVKI